MTASDRGLCVVRGPTPGRRSAQEFWTPQEFGAPQEFWASQVSPSEAVPPMTELGALVGTVYVIL